MKKNSKKSQNPFHSQKHFEIFSCVNLIILFVQLIDGRILFFLQNSQNEIKGIMTFKNNEY